MILCIKSMYTEKFYAYYKKYQQKNEDIIYIDHLETLKSSFSHISTESIKIIIDSSYEIENPNQKSLSEFILFLNQTLYEIIPKNITIDCHYFILSHEKELYNFEETLSFHQLPLYTSGKSLLNQIENFHFPLVFALINHLNKSLSHRDIFYLFSNNDAFSNYQIHNNSLILDYDFLLANEIGFAEQDSIKFKDYMFNHQGKIQKNIFELTKKFDGFDTLSLCQTLGDLDAVSVDDLRQLLEVGKQSYAIQVIYIHPLHLSLSQQILPYVDAIHIVSDESNPLTLACMASSIRKIIHPDKSIHILKTHEISNDLLL